MPYFPTQEESKYQCPKCKGIYVRHKNNIGCLVNHPPGTCCHYGEIKVG